MKNINKNSFLFEDITTLKGVGKRLEKYLKNKKIEKLKTYFLTFLMRLLIDQKLLAYRI